MSTTAILTLPNGRELDPNLEADASLIRWTCDPDYMGTWIASVYLPGRAQIMITTGLEGGSLGRVVNAVPGDDEASFSHSS